VTAAAVWGHVANLPHDWLKDSYDNAMAEALNGTFKAELVTLHGPGQTRRELEIAIVEWIDWYNHRRLHSEIGDIPPAEHDTLWYRQQDLALKAGTP
jgi:putative transposase